MYSTQPGYAVRVGYELTVYKEYLVMLCLRNTFTYGTLHAKLFTLVYHLYPLHTAR